jgi:hypothetical protein
MSSDAATQAKLRIKQIPLIYSFGRMTSNTGYYANAIIGL